MPANALMLVALGLLLPSPLSAQEPDQEQRPERISCRPAPENCRVGARVIDGKSGEAIAGAFVSMGNSDWSSSGLSDEAGVVVIEGVPAGKTEIVVVADLYEPLTLRVAVRDQRTPLVFKLSSSAVGSEEIVIIEDKAPNVAEPQSYAIDADDIRVLPGSGNDALKALQSLPGVARVPFGLGGLVLRGSSPRDSSVYLDGIKVPLLYHFGGLASFYPSSMLSSLEMVPGSFGARYGRAQGGIVTMSSRPGRADRWAMQTEVSLIDASLRAEGPGFAGGTWSLGLRRSYVDAVLGAVIPADSDFSLSLAPRYYDGQVRYDLELPSKKGVSQKLSATLFGSDDRLRFLLANDEPMSDSDKFDYVSRFVRAAVRLERKQGEVSMALTGWAGIDENSLRFNDLGVTRSTTPLGLRGDLTRTFASGYLSGGLDVQGGRNAFDIKSEPPPMPGASRDSGENPIERKGAVWAADTALWLEGLYRVDRGKLAFKPSLRLEHYGLSDEWVLDPRFNMSYELGDKVTLKESIGLYHQPPNVADLDPAFGNEDLQSSYTVQTTLGAEVKLPLGLKSSATGFYSEMYDLPVDAVTSATSAASAGSPLSGGVGAVSREFTIEQFGSYSYQENRGRGKNYGVEFLLEGSHGRPGKPGTFLAWLSYTYSRSLRRDDPRVYLDYRPYVLDQPHLLTALGSVLLTENWRLGMRVRYATGNPITPVVGTFFDTDTQSYQSVAGELLSERLPAFFQLDVRLDRRWQRSWGTISLFLDVQNLTNRVNPEGVSYNYDFSKQSYTSGLPIFPSLGLEYQP